MTGYRALLFDLDGTISETDSVHHPAWAEILRPHGYEVDWNFYRENISGRLNPEIVAEFMEDLSDEEGREAIEEKEADFRGRVDELVALPGLREFIEHGREAGMEVSLVSNAPKPNALAVLEALDLTGAFDPVVLAEEAGAGKPDPAPYLAALKKLGMDVGEALAFEDSPSGIRSAVAAGVPTVGVASTHDPEKLKQAGAFVVVEDFSDSGLSAMIFG